MLPPEDTINRGIAIVPERSRIFPDMSVLDNLRMGAYSRRVRERREESLQEVYALFPRLKERGNQKAKTLSGGERQMLALGRALMARPELLLLDEPTAGMSIEEVPAILEIIREIKATRTRTILLVEHKFDMILALSDSIAVLKEGRLICDDTPEAVSCNEEVLSAYLGGGVKHD